MGVRYLETAWIPRYHCTCRNAQSHHRLRSELTLEINQLNEWNKEIRQDIDIAKKDTSKFDEFIEQNKNRLRDVKTEINRIKDSINMLDIVKFVVSEEGVKSYIVKKILQLLNHKLAYYLKKMDSNC